MCKVHTEGRLGASGPEEKGRGKGWLWLGQGFSPLLGSHREVLRRGLD